MSTIERPERYAEIQWITDNGGLSLMRGYESNLNSQVKKLEAQGIKVTWVYLDKTNDEYLNERAKRFFE